MTGYWMEVLERFLRMLLTKNEMVDSRVLVSPGRKSLVTPDG
jgi:hypothetical protein